jgi:hypothetical protein
MTINSQTMLCLAYAGGAIAVILAWLLRRGPVWLRAPLQGVCLFLAIAAIAYWSAAPGAPHPVSGTAGVFLVAAVVILNARQS